MDENVINLVKSLLMKERYSNKELLEERVLQVSTRRNISADDAAVLLLCYLAKRTMEYSETLDEDDENSTKGHGQVLDDETM